MPTKIHWIHQFENAAKIGIMARPRGNDWLEEEINHLKAKNVEVLVSLLEPEEIAALHLEAEAGFCKLKNIEFINFPITDRDIPQEDNGIDFLITDLTEKIGDGKSIVIHCRMGIGRSSIIAAAVLLKYNLKAKDIMKQISVIRGLEVPDTDKQTEWLLSKEKEFGNFG